MEEQDRLYKQDSLMLEHQSFFFSPASILNSIIWYIAPLPLFPSACRGYYPGLNRQFGCFDYMDMEAFKCSLPVQRDIMGLKAKTGNLSAEQEKTIEKAVSLALKDYKPFVLPKAILQIIAMAAIIYVIFSILSMLLAWIDSGDKRRKALVLSIVWFLVVLPSILNILDIFFDPGTIFTFVLALAVALSIYIPLKTGRRRAIFSWIVLALVAIALIAVPIAGSYYAESYLQKRLLVSTSQENKIVACNETALNEGIKQCTNCRKACMDACKEESGNQARASAISVKGENLRCACTCFKSAVNAESKTTAISDITGNLVKIPFLKNAIQRANTAQQPDSSTMPSSGGDTAINNRKRSDRYSARQAFVVSDRDWHNVLSLVPASMWYERGELKKYPVLIYHEEDSGFDADSVLFFLNQYNAKKVVLVGDTPEELDNILIAEGYTYLVEAEVAPLAPLSLMTGRPIANIPGILPPGAEAARAPIRGIDLTPDWLTRISPDDYTRYWSSYNTIVVCEDNYQLGLLASVYAAYINAPLFFEGRIPSDVDLSRKRIITVGRTSYTGVERHSLESLERKLLEMYPTDKIILVNPNDLTIRETMPMPDPVESEDGEPYYSLLNRALISEIYSKTSLSAPFLAVGKKEFIITTSNTEAEAIKEDMTSKIRSYALKPNYLTIMASPPAIQMQKLSEEWGWWEEVDNRIYGDIDSDGFQDIAVGRIFTLTPSDVSAYVARDLFLEYLKSSKNFASLWPNYFQDMQIEGKSADREMRSAGFHDSSIYLNGAITGLDAERDLQDKIYIAYLDHGFTGGWGGEINTDALRRDYIKMSPSIVLSHSCLTCAYNVVGAHPKDLFCANILKHGAMAHIGAVDATGATPAFSQIIVDGLLHGKDIGGVFLKFRKIRELDTKLYNLIYDTREHEGYERHFILLGDPTLKIISSSPVLEETELQIIEPSETTKKIKLRFYQPTEEVRYETIADEEGNGYYLDTYVYPSGSVHIGGWKVITRGEYSSDGSRTTSTSVLHDEVYWEMGGDYAIRDITLKLKYSDGSERDVTLNKQDNFYYYEDDLISAYLLLVSAKGTYKFMMSYMEKDIILDKVVPSYEYELNIQTLELRHPTRIYAEVMPS